VTNVGDVVVAAEAGCEEGGSPGLQRPVRHRVDRCRARYYNQFQASSRTSPDQRLKVGLIYSYAANEAVDDDSSTTRASTPRAGPGVAGLPRRRDRTTTPVRHQLRHLGRQVPELLQGPVAAVEEPRDRPGDRGQHVPHRVRRHHAEHAVGRQEPASHGLIQAYSRTNRILNSVKTYGNIVSLPRPGAGDQRRHRAVRQQGRPRHRAAQAVRRVLRRVRREGGELLEVPARADAHRRRGAQKAFIALFGAILRCATSSRRSTTSPATRSSPTDRFRTTSSVYLNLYAEFRKATTPTRNDQRRRRLRDRAHQAGRDQRRLHPAARGAVPQAHGDGDDKEIRAEIRAPSTASPTLRNKKDLIEAFVDRLDHGEIDEQWRAFVAARRAAELEAIIADEGLRPDETARSSTARSATAPSPDRHRDHQSCRRLPLLQRRGPRREEAARARPLPRPHHGPVTVHAGGRGTAQGELRRARRSAPPRPLDRLPREEGHAGHEDGVLHVRNKPVSKLLIHGYHLLQPGGAQVRQVRHPRRRVQRRGGRTRTVPDRDVDRGATPTGGAPPCMQGHGGYATAVVTLLPGMGDRVAAPAR
jgi:hypothetical protein